VQAKEPFFADITPAYARMPVEAFEFVKRQFPRTKTIFLLRDPVDRHFSALRMREGRKGRIDAVSTFSRALERPSFRSWSEYHVTYGNLRAVFPKEDIFVGFYETLFADAEIERLCSFIGIPFIPGNYQEVINPSIPKKPVPEKEWEAARKKLADVYDFCRAEFGSAVPASWG
jgi:hypothetical protein